MSATVQSNPVFTFSVTNQNGNPYAGVLANDLRFTIAKLIPAPAPGMPSNWQNYVLRTRNAVAGSPGEGTTMVQGNRETPDANALPGEPGSLVNHGNGTYTYTFRTDITQGQALCLAPCKDAFGRTLDLSYDANLPHRVAVQTNDEPLAATAYDFTPATSTALPPQRDIVNYDNCNECHNKLVFHGTRTETRYCVTCHNLGSTDPSSYDPAKESGGGQHAAVLSSGTVDFKVLIHKLHRGEFLPSVVLGPDFLANTGDEPGEYGIYGYQGTIESFANVVFPQPIVNCTKCHDGSGDANTNPRWTAQGNNWNDVPSIEACGACHDNIKFDTAGPPVGADPDGHPGGPVNFNTNCTNCHATQLIGMSPAEAHVNHEKIAAGKFKFNILEICGVAVDMNPVCASGSFPTVKFSVEDPTGAGGHQYGPNGEFYNIRSAGGDPEFDSNSAASLNVLVAWETRDYNNTDGAGSRPSRAESTNARTSAAVVDNMDGTFTFTSPNAIPAGGGPNGYVASGSGAIGMEGHPGADFDGDGTFSDEAPATSEVAYFAIGDATPVPRRVVADAPTKCNNCHDILSLHGGNRNNNTQVCVLCHNPNNTDVARRPKTPIADPANPQPGEGIPDTTATLDGKTQEGIDFKRLIHAIHAGEAGEHGFREEGIVVYGYGGNAHDYGEVRFPGILSDCETCHVDDTYTLEDRSGDDGANWEMPLQSGILSSVIDASPNATVGGIATGPGSLSEELTLRADDLKISPTAAVCSACHDSGVLQAHMEDLGSALFNVNQAAIDGNVEQCVVCHGSGALADVEVVHEEATAREKGLLVP